ncbi:HSP20-like chaperone [Sesbania bispinosa]|nr:HSP20-like chaperone [Sesbania bispinosa]
MALARLALRNLQQRVSASLIGQKQRWGNNELVARFATAAGEKGKSEGSEVAVSEGKKSRLFPRRRGRRLPWRSDDRDFPPALYEFFPSGLGNALMQATENINRLFENMNLTPWSFSGRVKEKDDHYKLSYDMPGVAKEDADEIKAELKDGVLTVTIPRTEKPKKDVKQVTVQ